jgi:hypothetical protein
MPFLASNQIPSEGYKQAKLVANQLRAYALGLAQKWSTVNVSRDEVLATWQQLRSTHAVLTNIAAIPGIKEYAAAQENRPGYDVAAEFTGMLNAISAVTANIEAVFPKQNGFLLVSQFGVGGTVVSGTFTVQELGASGVIPLLQTLAATVA